MKALRLHDDILQVDNVPVPTPSGEDVLIRVKATAITNGELKWREVKERHLPIPGHDVAGVIGAVGDEVTGFEEGDEVIALIPFDQQGAAAEYALVSSHDLAIKPPSLSFAEAASLPLSGLTAYQALINHASATRCQKVLIIGAGGGTGVMAVQIAKSLRLVVSALCSGSKKDLVRSLGANAVFDYNINPPSSLCHDYDIVLDLVGGKTLSQCIKLVKGNGQMVCVACPATCDERSQRPDVRTDFFIVEPDGDELTEIVQMAEQGVIVPVVHTIIPFEKGAEAFKLLEKGHTTGKIVLTVDE